MNTTPKPAQVIAEGRPVLKAHPTIALDAAGLLHALDELDHADRLKARAYLLHVYGLTVGITDPATRALPEEWAVKPQGEHVVTDPACILNREARGIDCPVCVPHAYLGEAQHEGHDLSRFEP